MTFAARKRAVLLVVCSLMAAACTGDYSTNSPVVSAPSTTTSSSTPTPQPLDEAPVPLPPGSGQELGIEVSGTLAITVEHLVVTASPDGSNIELVDGGPDGAASQPVWSRDGSQLAWAHIGPEGESVGVRTAAGDVLYSVASGSLPFYLQWDAAGERLAYLRPEPSLSEGLGGGVEAGFVRPGEPVLPADSGQPFFLSWAPEFVELVALRSATDLVHLSPDTGSITLPEGEGPYTVPVWTSDDTILVSDDDSIDELNILSGTRVEVAQTNGPVRFTLSPDRNRVAYSPAADGIGPGSNDQLIVVNLDSGNERIVTEGSLIAWEWSPDSETLAWLEPVSIDMIEQASAQRRQLVWSFWTEGVVEAGRPYLPSDLDASAYLPFFEQYAQSHTRWSPSSQAFALAGSFDGFKGIWIQAIGFADQPLFITEGDAVTWGPEDPGEASGSKL